MTLTTKICIVMMTYLLVYFKKEGEDRTNHLLEVGGGVGEKVSIVTKATKLIPNLGVPSITNFTHGME